MLEGPDYTGKSTVAKYLADQIPNAIYYHSPAGIQTITEALYEIIKTNTQELRPNVKALLMLAGNIININAMNNLKMNGKIVVADRSILSMFAYQDVTIHLYESLKELFDVPSLQVDTVLLFTASKEEIMRRYKLRNSRDSLDEFFMQRIDTVIEKYYFYVGYLYQLNLIKELSTTARTADETCALCLRHIYDFVLTPSGAAELQFGAK